MRPVSLIAVLVWLFVLAQPVVAQVPGVAPAPPTVAPAPGAGASPAGSSRDQAEAWVRESLDATAEALRGAKDGVQKATGLNDDQIYGIGIGVLAGVAAADILGTGGLGSVAVVGLGGLVGNWIASRSASRP